MEDEFLKAWHQAMEDAVNEVPTEFDPDCPLCQLIMQIQKEEEEGV